MKFGNNSNSLLTHAIAKAKLVEFGVSEQDRPAGLRNANDLLYSTIHALSEFSSKYVRDENTEEALKELEFISTYYQSFLESEQEEVNYIWVLLGACANLLSDNFGNAKALLRGLKNFAECKNIVSQTILNYLNIILNGQRFATQGDVELIDLLQKEINGEAFDKDVKDVYRRIYKSISKDDSECTVLFRVLRALHKKVSSSLAIEKVPLCSDSTKEVWMPYFSRKKAIKVLWQAQKIIIEKEILKNKDALIQLPTGTGKTKCVELIIASAMLTRQVNLVIYVAPLKALCNEVTKDLYGSLSGVASINDISEVIQKEEEFDLTKKQVLVCTPEKLSYLIKNNKEVIESCGLIIFDEAHMFDDGIRGITYEILVTKIKDILPEQSQRLFISAVLPNAESINSWATGDKGVLITDDLIKKTDKNVAFYSRKADQIIFRMEDGSKRNVYIPKPIKDEVVVFSRYLRDGKINKKGSIKDYYPQKDDGKDVALSLAFKLCVESGVAIYTNTPKQVRALFDRMIKLADVDGMPRLKYEASEMGKLSSLIKAHYGECEFSKIVTLGVVPHYGDLPNGIRLAVEYAIKNNDTNLIICTSTLAEGVNLPIRYLIMTSFTNPFQEILTYRKFKNLFGRAARSGTYTEGSLICSDPRVIDDREKGARYFQWEKIKMLISDSSTDICGSSILSLCDRILYGYEEKEGYDGAKFVNELVIPLYIENCDVGIAIDNLITSIKANIRPSNPLWEMKFNERKIQVVSAIAIIESFVVDEIISRQVDIDEFEIEKVGAEIFSKTLAYHLANDIQKVALTNLFVAVTRKILKVASEKRMIFSKCVLGIDELNDILEYLEENRDKLFSAEVIDEDEWLKCIIMLSGRKYKRNKDFDKLNFEVKKLFLKQWIDGKTFIEILKSSQLDSNFGLEKIEKACGNTISFETAMVFSSIIELSEDYCNNENIINQLKLLQKKIQYGLSNKEDIFAYEKGFADRVVARKVGTYLREKITFDDTIFSITDNKESIAELLREFPSYFLGELDRYE